MHRHWLDDNCDGLSPQMTLRKNGGDDDDRHNRRHADDDSGLSVGK
ncbi:hypothetical protein SIL08_13560 [Scandinavium sp. V105_16]|uniref:Uncharacterized protein n=1 Tax=Scandinavium lactucae TaxID=3095028 RepID=A0AAJ2S2X5_9ENTR|nr:MULTISPECIES: hypothetical protein [unclassified Scandinavium]MDX6021299.1 hypothetical protein [Scandinavium sp. V105_16]MDX6033004.1 hypothetical protein [Scandinavium sp. V105_12]